MAELNELPVGVQWFLRMYRWRKIDPVPWTPLKKPLNRCRLALVSSAGMTVPGQKPFDESMAGGDFTYREIPSDARVEDMKEFHRSQSFDHAGIAADANLAFPLDRVREWALEGRVGDVNARHFSFMGSITAPGRFMRDTTVAVASALVEDQVDLVLLVPV